MILCKVTLCLMVVDTSVELAFIVVPCADVPASVLPSFFEPIDSLKFKVSNCTAGLAE